MREVAEVVRVVTVSVVTHLARTPKGSGRRFSEIFDVLFRARVPSHPMAEARASADMAGVKGDARDGRLSGPVHNLRHREREHVRKQMLADARDLCHVTRDAYVACAKGRTFSLPFACREVFNDFNSCLKQYTTEEELDRRVAQFRVKESS